MNEFTVTSHILNVSLHKMAYHRSANKQLT